MDGPARVSTPRHILLSTMHVDTTLFEGMAALRCTVGVAIVLVVGLVLRLPVVSAFGAVGAVSVVGGPPGAQGGPGSVTASIRHGGGGGGGCGGNGGQGGIVNNSNPGAASAGEPGKSFESLVDPTSLF